MKEYDINTKKGEAEQCKTMCGGWKMAKMEEKRTIHGEGVVNGMIMGLVSEDGDY